MHANMLTEERLDSLLFLHLVGGSKVIKEFAIHLHKRLQNVVNEGHNSSRENYMILIVDTFLAIQCKLEFIYFSDRHKKSLNVIHLSSLCKGIY